MLHTIATLLALYVFWLLLSGMFTPFLLAAGFGSAAFVWFFSYRMQVIDREGHPMHLSLIVLVFYWPWLIWEILKSGWDVSRLILDPRLPISPTLVRFKPTQRSHLGLVIHANSITLTPGTIAVDVQPDEFLVHALTREGAAGLDGSEMDRRVTVLEESH